jgi:hypothetical protein
VEPQAEKYGRTIVRSAKDSLIDIGRLLCGQSRSLLKEVRPMVVCRG